MYYFNFLQAGWRLPDSKNLPLSPPAQCKRVQRNSQTKSWKCSSPQPVQWQCLHERERNLGLKADMRVINTPHDKIGGREWEGNCLQLLYHLAYQPQYFCGGCSNPLIFHNVIRTSCYVNYPILFIRRYHFTHLHTFCIMYYVECVTLFSPNYTTWFPTITICTN